MEKIEVKDIKKTLNKKIKEIKNQKLALPKKLLEKTTNGYIKLRDKVRNYIPEEVKKEENKKEIESLTKKIERKENIVSLMKQSEDYDFGVGAGRLKEVKEEISKLRKKRIKREKKGLGVFALSKLILAQIEKNTQNKINKAKSNIVNKTTAVKDNIYEHNIKKVLAENVKEELELKEQIKKIESKIIELNNNSQKIEKNIEQILNQNPSLIEFYNNLSAGTKEVNESKGLH